MQKLYNKLKSQQGSSLFLAIIFFMLCFFVGGTVLAAATSNAGRIASMKASRQDYYTQRSAAIFVQDQFAKPGRLTISLTTVRELQVLGGANNSYVEKWHTSNMSSVDASEDQTGLQQLLSLAVAGKFYAENHDRTGVGVADLTVSNFDSAYGPAYITSSENTATGTVKMTGNNLPAFQASYSCNFNSNDDFGDLVLTIETDSAEKLFSVVIPASVTVTESVSGDGSSPTTMKRTETTTYTVIWGEASIQKGEAE